MVIVDYIPEDETNPEDSKTTKEFTDTSSKTAEVVPVSGEANKCSWIYLINRVRKACQCGVD